MKGKCDRMKSEDVHLTSDNYDLKKNCKKHFVTDFVSRLENASGNIQPTIAHRYLEFPFCVGCTHILFNIMFLYLLLLLKRNF